MTTPHVILQRRSPSLVGVTPPAARPPAAPPVVTPGPFVDDELTVMMASKAAGAMPPLPDARTARTPRQWAPVNELARLEPESMQVEPAAPMWTPPAPAPIRGNDPSLAPAPAPVPIPSAPSSLGGLAMPSVETTARVRVNQSSYARPTVAWAAGLVALGIFVGIGSAVVSRADGGTKVAAARADAVESGSAPAKLAPSVKVVAPANQVESSHPSPTALAPVPTPTPNAAIAQPPAASPAPASSPPESAGSVRARAAPRPHPVVRSEPRPEPRAEAPVAATPPPSSRPAAPSSKDGAKEKEMKLSRDAKALADAQLESSL